MVRLSKTLKEEIVNLRKNNIVVGYESLAYNIMCRHEVELNIMHEALESRYDCFHIFNGDPEYYYEMFLQELESDFGLRNVEVGEYDILLKILKKDTDLRYIIQKLGVNENLVNEVVRQEKEERKFFSEYTTNLNEFVKIQEVDMVGRDNELKLLEVFLATKNKQNVLIVGQPGVGKTTLVEALADNINKGQVGEKLQGKKIIRLEINKILGNTRYRGEFEQRLTDILDMSIKHEYILFIDEIHTVLCAGKSEGGISAANILKPYLLNPALRFIGATTSDEYHEITKDKAFNRRFHRIYLQEFDDNMMENAASSMALKLKKYHEVMIDDSNLKYIITQLNSEQFKDRYFPDKYLDFIDFLGAYYRGGGMLSKEKIDACFCTYMESVVND